ncbi:GGDEF domain-containing protein [Sphingobium ummariense]|uniref:diguanylate cyclase n=1 Tax=Sphingobium ummariense RL-3 TaxID=1346791 RepID=T0KCT2_9SPHN|nr:GGDEF domain-containing protein [Sphingobium ummariense]EQB31303.1 hypothetical protein M529_15410 [Sphingobium ummariense RL-3]
MRFYLATSFLFPRSLRMRLFALCFVATHLPLLGYIGWGAATGRIALAELALLVAATVAGTALALIGIGALLDPIHRLADALNSKDAETPVLPEVGDVIRTLYAGVQRTADATRERIENLQTAAHEDSLTGIANRRGFLAQLEALPADGRKGSVAIIDIDYFKQVNDQLGHDEGDRLLRAFAGRLASQVRRADIVARWGGEEFALFFQDCMEDEACWSLARIAERMRIDPLGEVNGRAISFSAGVARWAFDPLERALERADDALYEAKQAGRDQVRRAGRALLEERCP